MFYTILAEVHLVISIVIISKNELSLEQTLSSIESSPPGEPREILVVDASQGSLSSVRSKHPRVRWIDFQAPPGRNITIPHQRNLGVSEAMGDIVVFTDAGCIPEPEWLERLTHPIINEGERIAAGPVRSGGLHEGRPVQGEYVSECPTVNVAFEKSVWSALGGFDETFDYGSDIDFSWRAVHAGFRIRWIEKAVVSHDWGDRRRQLKRFYVYGKARTKLYRKHPEHRQSLLTTDRMLLGFSLFILGLPVGIWFPAYFLILAIPIWRVRHSDSVGLNLVYECVLAIGALVEFVRPTRGP